MYVVVCKTWCGDGADCMEMEEVLVRTAGLGDIMIYTTQLSMAVIHF